MKVPVVYYHFDCSDCFSISQTILTVFFCFFDAYSPDLNLTCLFSAKFLFSPNKFNKLVHSTAHFYLESRMPTFHRIIRLLLLISRTLKLIPETWGMEADWRFVQDIGPVHIFSKYSIWNDRRIFAQMIVQAFELQLQITLGNKCLRNK